jgi:hypothetical protein
MPGGAELEFEPPPLVPINPRSSSAMEDKMNVKEDTAKKLADAHRRIEPSILRIMTSGEESPAEPVNLLEVNRDTTPSGIVSITFGPMEGVPFPSVMVEVTPRRIREAHPESIIVASGVGSCPRRVE